MPRKCTCPPIKDPEAEAKVQELLAAEKEKSKTQVTKLIDKRPPLDDLLNCTGRATCEYFLGPGKWPSWLTEDEWYALLYEMYVAPPQKDGKLIPIEQALKLRRAGQKLHYMEKIRYFSESKSYKPVVVHGCALRMDAGNRKCWCDCPLEPCQCGGKETKPPRPLPLVGPSLMQRMVLGRRPPNELGKRPPHAWSWRGRGHSMAVKLQRAATDGCLCDMNRVGPPACPAPLLDLPCDRHKPDSFETRTLRRQLEELQESPQERANRETMEGKGVPVTYPNSGKEGVEVGSQTTTSIYGNIEPGLGEVLTGNSGRWTVRRNYKVKKPKKAKKDKKDKKDKKGKKAKGAGKASGDATGGVTADEIGFAPGAEPGVAFGGEAGVAPGSEAAGKAGGEAGVAPGSEAAGKAGGEAGVAPGSEAAGKAGGEAGAATEGATDDEAGGTTGAPDSEKNTRLSLTKRKSQSKEAEPPVGDIGGATAADGGATTEGIHSLCADPNCPVRKTAEPPKK